MCSNTSSPESLDVQNNKVKPLEYPAPVEHCCCIDLAVKSSAYLPPVLAVLAPMTVSAARPRQNWFPRALAFRLAVFHE